MKIAFINQPWNYCLPVRSGSISLWTYEVARRLARSCDVIVYERSGLREKVEWDEGVHYRRMSIGPDQRLLRLLKRFPGFRNVKRPLLASSLYYLGYVLQVANNLRAQQCDIVHLYNFSQFVPIIRALNPSIKIVLHMHGQWLTQLDQAMIARRLRKVDLIIGCSEYITEKIRRRFPQFAGRCQTVYNGVDVNHFVGKSDYIAARSNGAKRLLFVGRVSPEKGLHVLLDAFQKVIMRYPRAQLEIVGPIGSAPIEFIIALSDEAKVSDLASFYPGSYLSHLQGKLSSSVADQVSFIGPVPYPQMVNHYREADVYVQPSFSEAFPLPILEAMASGLPVVGTRVGGIPEAVLNDKTGLLVEPGDALALAEAVLRFLSDKDLRKAMGKAGRQRVLDLFSWEQIAKNLLDQYKSIL